MPDPAAIAKALLEADDDELRRLARAGLDAVGVKWSRDTYNVDFGFAIKVYMEVQAAMWEEVEDDCHHLERNAMNLLNKNGIHPRSEGHSEDDLIGTAWLSKTGPACRKMARLLSVQGEEGGIGTARGNINFLDDDAVLYDGVSRQGMELLDVDITFFNTEHLEELLREMGLIAED